jgi:Tfp pilus assembly protein PilV
VSLQLFSRVCHRRDDSTIPNRDDDGFTIMEAVVSLTLFLIVSIAAVSAIVNSIRITDLSNNRVVAANLAQADIEQARAQTADQSVLSISTTGYPKTTTVGSSTYTVSRAASGTCPTTRTAGTLYYLNLPVTVSWAQSDSGGTRNVRADTVIAC